MLLGREILVSVAALVAALGACAHAPPPVDPGRPPAPAGACGAPIASAAGDPGPPPRQVLQTGHAAAITDASFSRDGALVTASADGSLRRWDSRSRALLGVARSPLAQQPMTVAWLPGSPARLAVTSWNKAPTGAIADGDGRSPVVLDGDGRLVAFPKVDAIKNGAKAFSNYPRILGAWPGGEARWLVSDCTEETVKVELDGATHYKARVSGGFAVLDGETGARAFTLAWPAAIARAWPTQSAPCHSRAEIPLNAGSADGERFAAAIDTMHEGDGKGGVVVLWSVRDGAATSIRLPAAPHAPWPNDGFLHDARPTALAFSPRGDRLAIADDGHVDIVSTARPSVGAIALRTGLSAVRLAWSPDGERLFMRTHKELSAWEVATARPLWRRPREVGEERDRALLVSPDGSHLVAIAGALAELFDAATGRPLGALGGAATRHPRAIGVGPGGALAVLTEGASRDARRVSTWSLESGLLTGRTASVSRDALSAPGRAALTLASLTKKDRRGGTLSFEILGPDGAALVAEGPPIAVAAAKDQELDEGDVSLRAVDAARTRIVTKELPREAPESAAAMRYFHLFVHELASGEARELALSSGSTDEVVFADGGRRVGALDGGYRVWDAGTGALLSESTIRIPGDPRGRVGGGALAEDGRRVVVFRDRRVSLRTVPEGAAPIYEVDAPAEVTAVAFGAAADAVFVGDSDGGLARYEGGKLVARSRSQGGAIRAITPRRDGALVVTTSDDDSVRVWDGATVAERVALAEFVDDEHLAFSPRGAFWGSAEGADRVAWVWDGARPEAFRFEQFASLFRSRELITRRLAGDLADAPARIPRPPALELLGPPSLDASGRSARVRVRVRSGSRVDRVVAFDEARPAASADVCKPAGELELGVPLVAGRNVLSVSAFDDRGYAANPVSAEVIAPSGAKRSLWIVSVGVDAYPRLPPGSALSYAAADARGVASLAEHPGVASMYERTRAKVLVNEQATPEAIRAALGELAQMQPDDVAIVFLAGHGVKPSADADMVFLTSAIAAAPGSTLERMRLPPDALAAAGLGWRDVGARLARARGRVLVLLDACHSGHVSQETLVPNTELAASLVRDQRAGALVLAAAKGRQLSFEPSGARGLALAPATRPLVVPRGEGHGFFTGALLASLGAPDTDKNHDGTVQLSELVDDVVTRVTKATGGAQTPWVARRELFGDFGLLPTAAVERP